MDWLEGVPVGEITGPAALVLVALMVITDKLVWHTRLKEERADRLKWQQIALGALGVAEKLTDHAEVTNEVLQAIPIPPDPPKHGGSP